MVTMKNRAYIKALIVLTGFLLFNSPAFAETSYEVTLNHDIPSVMLDGETVYAPIIEKAYVVAPHIIMTRDVNDGHFPDDGVISGTDIKVWFYLVDWGRGIKIFLVEEALEISENMPEWALSIYSVAADELEKDSGWACKINSLKRNIICQWSSP